MNQQKKIEMENGQHIVTTIASSYKFPEHSFYKCPYDFVKKCLSKGKLKPGEINIQKKKKKKKKLLK